MRLIGLLSEAPFWLSWHPQVWELRWWDVVTGRSSDLIIACLWKEVQ